MKLLLEQASGVMVALYIPKEIAEQIAVEGGEPAEDLHVTLAYIPGIGEDKEKFDRMCDAMKRVATKFQPIDGHVGGIGRFNSSDSSDGKDVYYASYDATGLVEIVDAVHRELREFGFDMSTDHGFTPHITLKYIDKDEPTPDERKVSEEFTVLQLSVASRSLDPRHYGFGLKEDRLFESINDLAPEESFGEGSEWDSEFCGDVAQMLRTEVSAKFDTEPTVAYSSDDESAVVAAASRLRLRHIAHEIVPEGHKFLLMVDRPDLKAALGTFQKREANEAEDKKGIYNPKGVDSIKFEKADFKVAGATQLWQAEVKTSRNMFEASIYDWDVNGFYYKRLYPPKGDEGKNFQWETKLWTEGGNFSGFVDIVKYGGATHGIQGSGFSATFEEAVEAVKKVLHFVDQKFFYRKSEFYPYDALGYRGND